MQPVFAQVRRACGTRSIPKRWDSKDRDLRILSVVVVGEGILEGGKWVGPIEPGAVQVSSGCRRRRLQLRTRRPTSWGYFSVY